MSEEEKTFEVSLKKKEGYQFSVDFGLKDVENLIMDEPEPVGEGKGPNASSVLAAAVGNCLSASLLFCLDKSLVEVRSIETDVKGFMRRNEEGRWRIAGFTVEIRTEVDEKFKTRFKRCTEIFEDFCINTQSLKQGIPIKVNVH